MPQTQTFFSLTLGHYQILREAGRGGMSMVYEAQDTRIQRRVALKVLSAPLSMAPDQRAAMIARLKREARAIARLSHPNIVTIFDIGEEGPQHFLVMEFLEGLTLRERLAEGPLTLTETAAILDGVAAGLDTVHAAGIIHRDIKPSNVMLLPGGGVKLMDFGVARQHEDTLVTQAGSIVGSPTYMAPEQTEGAESSAASDLWSLGVTLYEMLAGRPPFAGESVPRILYQVVHEKPPLLTQLTPEVREVLNRALEKRPARRYKSARQLAEAFRAALPASAARPSAPAALAAALPRASRVRSASSRRPFAWAAGLLLLAFVGALFGASRHAPALPRLSNFTGERVAGTVRSARLRPTPAVKAQDTAAVPAVRVASWQKRRDSRHLVRPPHRIVQTAAPKPSKPALLATAPPRRSAAPVVRRRKRVRPQNATEVASAVSPQPLASSRPSPRSLVPDPVPASTPGGPASSPAPPAAASGPNLTGTWHGTLTNHRATLVISRHQGNDFQGTMSVRTGGYEARVAVTGRISPRTGQISMRETRRLPGTAANAWDLGTESGRVEPNGRISGTGTDARHHFGTWSFSR